MTMTEAKKSETSARPPEKRPVRGRRLAFVLLAAIAFWVIARE